MLLEVRNQMISSFFLILTHSGLFIMVLSINEWMEQSTIIKLNAYSIPFTLISSQPALQKKGFPESANDLEKFCANSQACVHVLALENLPTLCEGQLS